MAYSKTTWANGTTPAISADNLNKMEQGILDASLFSDFESSGKVKLSVEANTAHSSTLDCIYLKLESGDTFIFELDTTSSIAKYNIFGFPTYATGGTAIIRDLVPNRKYTVTSNGSYQYIGVYIAAQTFAYTAEFTCISNKVMKDVITRLATTETGLDSNNDKDTLLDNKFFKSESVILLSTTKQDISVSNGDTVVIASIDGTTFTNNQVRFYNGDTYIDYFSLSSSYGNMRIATYSPTTSATKVALQNASAFKIGVLVIHSNSMLATIPLSVDELITKTNNTEVWEKYAKDYLGFYTTQFSVAANSTHSSTLDQIEISLSTNDVFKIKMNTSATITDFRIFGFLGTTSAAIQRDLSGNTEYELVSNGNYDRIGVYAPSNNTAYDVEVLLSTAANPDEDVIETYYETEMTDTLEKVKNALSEPSIVFPTFTDSHRYSNNVLQNFSETIANIKHLCNRIKCDFVLNLGDLTDGNGTQETTLTRAFTCLEDLMKIPVPYLFSNGNHDTNYASTVSGQYLFDIEEIYKAYYSNSRVSGYNLSENGTDYYLDFESLGVRFISLNANNIKDGGMEYRYGLTTETWLEGALNTDNVVILLVHQSVVKEHTYNAQATTFGDNIKAKLQSFVNNGGTLIELNGHAHADFAFIDPWVTIAQTCHKFEQSDVTTSGYLAIEGYIDELVSPSRTSDTLTKDAWSVNIYNAISKVFRSIRFGAGCDRIFHIEPISSLSLTTELSGTITWSSSDSNVATVSNGTVTEVGSGKCAVIAKDTNGNYECWIVVVE